jgi:DNA-directed RNA polymerase subunit RPC12/RpoP
MPETTFVCCQNCGTENEVEELEWEEDNFGRKAYCPECSNDTFDSIPYEKNE